MRQKIYDNVTGKTTVCASLQLLMPLVWESTSLTYAMFFIMNAQTLSKHISKKQDEQDETRNRLKPFYYITIMTTQNLANVLTTPSHHANTFVRFTNTWHTSTRQPLAMVSASPANSIQIYSVSVFITSQYACTLLYRFYNVRAILNTTQHQTMKHVFAFSLSAMSLIVSNICHPTKIVSSLPCYVPTVGYLPTLALLTKQ